MDGMAWPLALIVAWIIVYEAANIHCSHYFAHGYTIRCPSLPHYMLGLPEYPYSVIYYVLSYTVTQSITSSNYEQTAMM
jgi:hypothetical protein